MSDAADKLAQTRLAIIDHVQRRERRREGSPPRDEGEVGIDEEGWNFESASVGVSGWFARLKRMAGTWWQHHPARTGVDLAAPLLSAYAERKPFQLLAISALVGALVVVARPWRLISVTGLLVALIKSSQLSGMVLSAMSAADYGKDRRPPL